MVYALLALGLVMIVGGIAAVIQGFPYVRIETGMALVTGGATTAAAGAVMLGLAAVVACLKRIDLALGEAIAAGNAPNAWDKGYVDTAAASGAGMAGTAGLEGLALERPSVRPSNDGEANFPALDQPPRNRDELPEAEPLLPDLLPGNDGTRAKNQPPFLPDASHSAAPSELPARDGNGNGEGSNDDDLFAPADSDKAVGLRPSLPSSTRPDRSEPVFDAPQPAAAASREAPRSAEPGLSHEPDSATKSTAADEANSAGLEVIGTHSSGGNSYIMYANGTIEADTPKGRYNFESLEELRAFVEAGGETGKRGAA